MQYNSRVNIIPLIRVFWRIFTLLFILSLAYVTTVFVVPYLDRRLPIFPVVLITYAVVAYVLIPLVIRFWRLVMKPNHIPRYTLTPDGWPADPVNIAVIAKSKRHFIATMKAAGWYTADPSTPRNLLREGYAILFDKPYFQAPFSAFYLFGRKFDIGFQIPYGNNLSPRHRHHVRFWRLVEQPNKTNDSGFNYWFTRIKHLFGRKKTIWIGAAIDDTSPIALRWRNLQITHANNAEHTVERDFIIDTLKQKKLIRSIRTIKDGEPFKLRSQNIGSTFYVDGYLKVVELKSGTPSLPKKS